MNRAIIPERKSVNGLSLFNVEEPINNTSITNSSANLDLNADKNYINGLIVNGNLIIYGTLYTYRNIYDIPTELQNTLNKNIKYDSDTIFEGDLYIHPTGVLNISGDIISNKSINK